MRPDRVRVGASWRFLACSVLAITMLVAWQIISAAKGWAQDPNIHLSCNQDVCIDKNFQVGRNPGTAKGVHIYWTCVGPKAPDYYAVECVAKQNMKTCKLIDGGCYCEFNEHLTPGALGNLYVEVCCEYRVNDCPSPGGPGV